MTAPRLYVRNSTYLFTRRCSERRFFLRPSTHTNQTYLYCLGKAAEIGDGSCHVAAAMSNHHHLTLTDRREGDIAHFAEWMHGQLGRANNASLGRWEGFLCRPVSGSLWQEHNHAISHEFSDLDQLNSP